MPAAGRRRPGWFPVGPPLARERLEEVVLALAFERRQAEDLATPEGERDTLDPADPQVLDREHRLLLGHDRRRGLAFAVGAPHRLGFRLCGLRAEHEVDDLGLAALLRHDRADVRARPGGSWRGRRCR